MESKILGLQKLVMNNFILKVCVEAKGKQETPNWQAIR